MYIYIYIEFPTVAPIPDAVPRNVSSDPGPTLPLAKMNESPRRSAVKMGSGDPGKRKWKRMRMRKRLRGRGRGHGRFSCAR